MVYKKELITPLAEIDVLKILSTKTKSSGGCGYVQGSKFCIFMTALHSGNRTRSKYIFRGYIDCFNDCTIIHYSLRPTILTIAILCINFSLLIKSVVQYIRGADNTAFLLICLIANVLAVLIVIWQEQQCMQRFEKNFI